MSTTDELTRKQRREQAREQRRAIEAAQAAQAARRRRMMQLGAALAAALVVVVALVVISTGGSKSAAPPKPVPVTPVSDPVIANIAQSGNALGSATAPVTMDYYGDLECPVCQRFHSGSLPQVIANYVRTNKVKIHFRSLETATTSHSTFVTQQVAALAAGKQNKMWQYLDLFYQHQGTEGSGYVTESYLQGLAKAVPGLNLVAWQSARSDNALTQQVTSDEQSAAQTGFNSTPTIVVRGPHGAKAVSGLAPYSTIAQMIQGVS